MKRVLAGAGLLLGLAVVAVPAQAQSGTLRGTVVDVDQKPFADVTVTIEFTGGITRKFETKTNGRGEFLQVGLASGDYKLTFSKDGYRDVILGWHISSGLTELPQPVKLEKGPKNAADFVAKVKAAFKEAVDLTDAGKYDEAEAAYKAILVTNPDISAVYKNLGYVYLKKKDYPAAETVYLKVLDLEPGDPDAALSLGEVYNAMGQKDKAKEMLDKATEANPGDPTAQFKKGLILRNADDSEGAIKAFQAVVDVDPTNAEAYYNLGELMVGAAKFPEAIQFLEKYLSFNPTNAQHVSTAQQLIKALKK